MKNQVGRPDLGSRGKSLCLYFLCFFLSLLFIFCFSDSFIANSCTGLKPTLPNQNNQQTLHLTESLKSKP